MKAKELANKYSPWLIEAHTIDDEAVKRVLTQITNDFMEQLNDLILERAGMQRDAEGKTREEKNKLILDEAMRHGGKLHDALFLGARQTIIQKYRAFARELNEQFKKHYDINQNILKEDGLEDILNNVGKR